MLVLQSYSFLFYIFIFMDVSLTDIYNFQVRHHVVFRNQ